MVAANVESVRMTARAFMEAVADAVASDASLALTTSESVWWYETEDTGHGATERAHEHDGPARTAISSWFEMSSRKVKSRSSEKR